MKHMPVTSFDDFEVKYELPEVCFDYTCEMLSDLIALNECTINAYYNDDEAHQYIPYYEVAILQMCNDNLRAVQKMYQELNYDIPASC